MIIFEDIEDVEEWLRPFDYIGVWNAVAPYGLTLQDRDFCDDLIASGKVAQDLILEGLKILAQSELTRMFGLRYRSIEPLATQTLRSVH